MRVVIAGGHGKIALLLERLLTERGDSAIALIRNPAHDQDVLNAGADPVLLDLESASIEDVAAVLAALLDEPRTRHRTLELTGGDTPIQAAVRALT